MLFAFEPLELGDEFERAGLEVGGELEWDEEHHVVVINVVGLTLERELLRRRPEHLARRHTLRQVPLNRRGDAEAGVPPVGVPLRLHVQVDAGHDGVAGLGGVGGEEELGRGLVGGGEGGRGAAKRGKQEQVEPVFHAR